MYVGSLVFSFFCDFLQTYFMQWTGQMVMFDLRSQIFRHLQRMHIGFYDKNPVGRLVTRVTTDVDALNEMFTSGVVSIFEDVFVLLGIIVIMLRMNWKLALITFAVLPLIVWATKIFRDKVRDSYRRIRVAIARINSYLQEARLAAWWCCSCSIARSAPSDNFPKMNASPHGGVQRRDHGLRGVLPGGRNSVVAIAGSGSAAHHLDSAAARRRFAQHLRHHSERAGLRFMQYAQRFFRPIQDLSEKYNILQSAMAASERIFKLLDTPVEITSPAVTKTPEGPGRIEFDHVWFAYGVRGTAADTLAQGRSCSVRLGDGSSCQRARLGAARCVLHHRAGRDRRHRRPHRRRQDHASSPCCCASTTCRKARSGSMASTSRRWTWTTCAAASASCCRIRSCSPARSTATSAWARSGSTTRTSRRPPKM